MKVLHWRLALFTVERFAYHENILPRQNKLNGHDVSMLASTEYV
jgi:1,2-diacylglycerol 3-alpha-glucosyltransferase